MSGELTGPQEQQLLECYRTLHGLAEVDVPAVRAAVRRAVAELQVALEGQALVFEFYSHQWDEAALPVAA
ncbi:hypothetical protein GCM10009827_080400 [Dactylosporangium maewongense]|uniref:Uncharacterized protein n=1 Tax=Dactylosporangium maewongense TaxID=634393 RepID=A0ABP4MNW2_9ACTN